MQGTIPNIHFSYIVIRYLVQYRLILYIYNWLNCSLLFVAQVHKQIFERLPVGLKILRSKVSGFSLSMIA